MKKVTIGMNFFSPEAELIIRRNYTAHLIWAFYNALKNAGEDKYCLPAILAIGPRGRKSLPSLINQINNSESPIKIVPGMISKDMLKDKLLEDLITIVSNSSQIYEDVNNLLIDMTSDTIVKDWVLYLIGAINLMGIKNGSECELPLTVYLLHIIRAGMKGNKGSVGLAASAVEKTAKTIGTRGGMMKNMTESMGQRLRLKFGAGTGAAKIIGLLSLSNHHAPSDIYPRAVIGSVTIGVDEQGSALKKALSSLSSITGLKMGSLLRYIYDVTEGTLINESVSSVLENADKIINTDKYTSILYTMTGAREQVKGARITTQILLYSLGDITGERSIIDYVEEILDKSVNREDLDRLVDRLLQMSDVTKHKADLTAEREHEISLITAKTGLSRDKVIERKEKKEARLVELKEDYEEARITYKLSIPMARVKLREMGMRDEEVEETIKKFASESKEETSPSDSFDHVSEVRRERPARATRASKDSYESIPRRDRRVERDDKKNQGAKMNINDMMKSLGLNVDNQDSNSTDADSKGDDDNDPLWW